jgi:hypothetical protein
MAGQNPHQEGSYEHQRWDAHHVQPAQNLVYITDSQDSQEPAAADVETVDDPKVIPWIVVGLRDPSQLYKEDENILISSSGWFTDNIINGFVSVCNDINFGLQKPIGEFKFTPHTTNAAVNSHVAKAFGGPNDTAVNVLRKLLEPKSGARFRARKALYDCASFEQYIMPYNIDNLHWITVSIVFAAKEIRVYDSLTDNSYDKVIREKIIKYLERVKSLYKEHRPASFATIIPEEFKLIRMTNFVTQKDGWNCGVFTCMAIERLLFGASLNDLNPLDARKYRDYIMNMLKKYENISQSSADSDDDVIYIPPPHRQGSRLFRTGRMLSMLLLH